MVPTALIILAYFIRDEEAPRRLVIRSCEAGLTGKDRTEARRRPVCWGPARGEIFPKGWRAGARISHASAIEPFDII